MRYPRRRPAAIFSGLACALLLSACSADTEDATQITPSEATLHAVLDWESGDNSAHWLELRKRPTGGWFRAPVHDPGVQGQSGAIEIAERVQGLTPATRYQFRLCGYMTAPKAAGSPSNPICFDSTGDAGASYDTFTASNTPPRLRQVDGGTGYYGQFSRPLPTSPGYFPIAGWLRKAESQSHFDRYAEFGMNTLVGVEAPEVTDEPLIRQAGMRAFIQADERTRFDDLGSETAGWLLADEIDMTEGPSACNGSVNNIIAGLPQDGRALYNNYGKGVLLWETNAQASCFVNKQDVTSTDLYWHTDPNQTTMVAPPFLPEFDPDPDEEWISGSTVKRSANYGYQVDRVRQLDAMDGERQPIWNFVELGWPWSEPASNADRIQPAEVRAAVWHSIIAGARGIIYFDHNFNGPCGGSTILGQCYADTRAMAQSVNAQIRRLAPVLNAPFDDSYATASPSVRIMSKHLGGVHYVFAASRQNAASTPRFTVRTGTVARVVGERRSIPITNGRFTDTFANGNAVHIYRIG
jgi:hypothetical protein